MALPLSFLTPGRAVSMQVDGARITGSVIACANGWLRLAAPDGEVLINLALVSWVRGDGAPAPTTDDDLPRPVAKDVIARPGSKAPGRPWTDGQIQAVIDEFLNDRQDGEIAEVHGRTRNQVTVLRQAWECARGNLADDGISPAAQLWVERIRRAMRPG
jgi:hypothetical protein